MKKSNKLTLEDVKHVAALAKLPLTTESLKRFLLQLSSVIDCISKIQTLDTDNVIETSQVTGLENVLREDEIDLSRMFSQEQALSNAKRTYKGYFVVKAILEKD